MADFSPVAGGAAMTTSAEAMVVRALTSHGERLLAQPEPEGVSADEWDALVERAWDKYKTVGYQGELFMYDSDFGNALDFVRKELAPWGRPTPQHLQPVAVSERLPGAEDCIKRGNDHWCWGQERSLLTGQASARWRLMRVSALTDEAVNWLPANALPTPTPEAPNV
jgi:hypothetical protein